MRRKDSRRIGTKKYMIEKMLRDKDSKYSARDIALAVGTTEGNVFKEKSKLKASGILTDQKFSLISHSVGDDILTVARAEAKTLVSRSDLGALTDIPPLGQEDLKKMYTDFQNDKTPVEVIAENGFNPVLVEYEYTRFCRMNNLNLKALTQDLVGLLASNNSSLSGDLWQKIEQEGITCNNDITELFEFALTSSYSNGEMSVIQRVGKGETVWTLRPLICSICRKPMKGAIIDPDSEISRKLMHAIGSKAVHNTCIHESS